MNNYEKLYYTLFNKITDVIHILEAIQQEAEEMILSQDAYSRQGNIIRMHKKTKRRLRLRIKK